MNYAALNRSLLSVALATALLLLVPLVAMRFTREVSWGAGDFLVAGALLFAAGTATVAALSRFKRFAPRVAAVAAIAAGLVVVWAELAVGLFR